MSDFETFLAKASSANVAAVVETLPADLLTPLAVYIKLASTAPNSFLLESVEGGESLARYSFIGADPEMIVTGGDDEVVIEGRSAPVKLDISLFQYLREHFACHQMPADPDIPSFAGGAIGYMDFDCAEWFEPTLKNAASKRSGKASGTFMFYRSLVAFDHVKQVIRIISLVFKNAGEGIESLKAGYQSACAANKKIRGILEYGQLKLPEAAVESKNSEVKSNWERRKFENAVRDIKELISAGECYQVVISQCFSRETSASPISIYRAMRSINPSPYMFLLQVGGRSLIGASPEMLVRCRENELEYRPIAGTRPRGKNPEKDALLAEEMRADEKETAEHQMLVDLGRNDLGKVSKYGSVRVSGLMSVEKYSHVQHLVSYLSSDLANGRDRFDALAACFPAGTVSGAPKVRAIEIIRGLEPTPRGVYAGTVGYFDYAGNMDTCIAIRTLVLENGIARIQAGAGIVADSIPEAEYQETVNKAKGLLKAIEFAEGFGQ